MPEKPARAQSSMKTILPPVLALVLVLSVTDISSGQGEYAGRGAVGAMNSVYRVVCVDLGSGATAFGHRSGKVITAGHVVKNCEKSKIVLRNSAGETAGVSGVVVDDDRDLALLTPTSKFVASPLAITTESKFSAAVSRVVEERTTIDHAAMRIAILQEREPLRELFLGQVDRWKEATQEDKTKRLEFREVIALGHLLVKMAEVGAGLPKEHVARHDEVDDTIAVGRREMKSLEGAVVGLAEWKRERRKAKEAAEEEA